MKRSLRHGCIHIEDRRVHIIGLGGIGTGREVAKALAARGAAVTVSDVKPASALAAEIRALEGSEVVIRTDEDAYQGIEEADLVVPSPGVPLDSPPLVRARERGAIVVSDIEVAYWISSCPIVAVTGTKGKTTTTVLIGELLRNGGVSARTGGNIGTPLVAAAEAAQPDDILVAEVSSFQLEAIRDFRPRVAVMLNVTPDHLDRHRTMDAYTEAKARIFVNQQSEDTAVLNRDDGTVWRMRNRTRAQVVPYSLTQRLPAGADVHEAWLRVAGDRICPVSALQLRGRHNLSNVLAALGAAHSVGADLARAEQTLSQFEGVEHRLELIDEVAGVLFVNDSQATAPQATIAALGAFGRHIVLIAGGRAKVHDFLPLGEKIAERKASLVLIGEAADEIAAAASAAGADDIARASDLGDAVRQAVGRARPGDVVLLSPACASFDMFGDMAERGEAFREAVRQHAGRTRSH
jgi:UDP-N-acetylmuramoylalanine--D-glutamate ligase